jgi:hypothetical protein
LSFRQGQACYPGPLRRGHYRHRKTGKEYVFLTNRLDLSALEVAELYRRRWRIDLFQVDNTKPCTASGFLDTSFS